jgi:hypothetical protein
MTIGVVAPHSSRQVAGVLVLACTLFAASVALAVARDRLVAPVPAPPIIWLQSPALLDRVALQFDALAADIYWIRAVVYYGGVRRSVDPHKTYDLLYPLLDIATTLDPAFLQAYRMGAIFLSEEYPGGAGRPDLAIALLEKGLKARPNAWQLLHDIGFVHFWTYRDFATAARWMDRASRVPGSPPWLKAVVAGMLIRGDDRSSARLLWTEMLQSDERMMQAAARLRLAQLNALDDIDALHSLIARATLASGRRPTSWRDLIAGGWLREVPRDPSGTPYAIDPLTARVTVAAESGVYPLPNQLGGP